MKSILSSLLITTAVVSLLYCNKDENKSNDENGLNIKTFVNSPAGLVLRAGPDVSTEALANVPYKEQVIIIKYSDNDSTIEKIKAPWAYVKFKHLKGWLFSGYLKGELRTGNFKNHDLTKLIQTVSAAYKMEYQGKVYNTPDQITIKQIEGDLCVVGYTAIEKDDEYGDITDSIALWYFSNEKWNDFDIIHQQSYSRYPTGMEISLEYIDPDEFVDIVSTTGVAAAMSLYVYKNNNGSFKLIEKMDTSAASLFENDGTCSSKIIRLDDNHSKGDKITMKYNCRTSKYDIIKKEYIE
jgi:hypothetical protein